MPFSWTLNPYRGCTHGCHYCFARRYQPHLGLGVGDEFSSLILVKVNFADVLRQELSRPTRQRELIGFGTATDPYQPIEGHYRLTRRSLEALIDHPSPVGLVTKGPMVVRDLDLLVELSRRTACTVHMSVPTVDDEAWRALEPGTAHPLQRLRAVRTLADAGIEVGVLVAPVVPGLTSQPAKLEQTIAALRALLSSEAKQLSVVLEELEEVCERFGDVRTGIGGIGCHENMDGNKPCGHGLGLLFGVIKRGALIDVRAARFHASAAANLVLCRL